MSLPVLASDPGQIEAAADPAGYVILACERAKTWLTQALEHGDIGQIIELKSQAEVIRVYTAQKQIGKDAELAAAEIVRRAERGIGVAVRRAQEAGEIAKKGFAGPVTQDYERVRHGRRETVRPGRRLARGDNGSTRLTTEFFDNTKERQDIYAVTDAVSDEQFESALAIAKEEENLTRANVVRKVHAVSKCEPGHDLSTPIGRRSAIRDLAAQGYSSRQIGEQVGMLDDTVRRLAREMDIHIPADAVIGKSRRHDSNRIVEETVHALDGLRMGTELIDFTALDPAKLTGWSSSLTASLRSLNQLARRIKELNEP